MSTMVHDWVQRLQGGTLDLFDLEAFEKLKIEDLTRELSAVFPVRFLERRHGHKEEIGVAQRVTKSKRWATRSLHQCLLVTSEAGSMTGMAVITEIRLRPSQQEQGSFELISGAGFNVYHDPDGWRIKLLHQRTVVLRQEALRARGWLLLNGNGTGGSEA
jgi:hypothetical protein